MRGDTRSRHTIGAPAWVFLGVAAILAAAGPRAAGADPDDLIFRPTVIVRTAIGQGSGTIIASVDGETLILTASHGVRKSGPVQVELHRYNLGVEDAVKRSGWPVTLAGEVAAVDAVADVAVVRVRSRRALPFVARLAAAGDEPADGAAVTSVGVDGGERLDSWTTRVHRVAWFALAFKTGRAKYGTRSRTRRGGGEDAEAVSSLSGVSRPRSGAGLDPGERPFLITDRAPEHGRSGGGLFLEGDRLPLVGVCVGRATVDGKLRGIFSSAESVRRLLRANDMETLVARSEALHETNAGRPLILSRAWLRGR